jgi:DNA-binding transcriptional ArsR family regulator
MATTEPKVRPQGVLVRDLAPRAAAARPDVVLEARTAVDFLVSLVGDTEPELQPADRDWLEQARASLTTSLRRDVIRSFGQLGGGTDDEVHAKAFAGWGLVSLLAAQRQVRTAADAVAFSRTVTAAQIMRAACAEDELGPTRVLAGRFFAGDTAVEADLIASAPEAVRDAVTRLVRDPEGELRSIRRVLRAWHEQFAPIEERVRVMEERDVEARRADFDHLPLADAIERATNGYRPALGNGTQHLLLVPSYFGRPYNYTFAGEGWHLIAYPLAEGALDGDTGAAPAATVRLFRALGDDSRMRILRYLADGDLYLTEIADRMGTSKPTAKHHLAQLRAAGLVTVTEAGNMTYYSLRRDRVEEAGSDLTRYLGLARG